MQTGHPLLTDNSDLDRAEGLKLTNYLCNAFFWKVNVLYRLVRLFERLTMLQVMRWRS